MKLVTVSIHRTCYIRSTMQEAEKPPALTKTKESNVIAVLSEGTMYACLSLHRLVAATFEHHWNVELALEDLARMYLRYGRSTSYAILPDFCQNKAFTSSTYVNS